MRGRRLRRLAAIVAACVAIAAAAFAAISFVVASCVGGAWTGAPSSETSAHEVSSAESDSAIDPREVSSAESESAAHTEVPSAESESAALAEVSPAESEPVIVLAEVPAYGENRPIEGRVLCENGDALDPEAYRVSLFLQLQEGGTYYPKPSYTTPDVGVDKDGSFEVDFVTGGRDSEAEVLHLMLVPAGYEPGSFDDVLRQATDCLRVDRNKDGAVVWDRVGEVP